MLNYSYDIYLDTSGNPKDKIFFGAISLNTQYTHDFKKDFEIKFPGLLSSKNNKGKDLSNTQLRAVLNVIHKHNMWFSSGFIYKDNWENHKQKYSNKAFFTERIIGGMYYQILERLIKKKCSIRYNVVFCKDNKWNYEKAINYTRYLLGTNYRGANLSSTITKFNHELKFADIVASAHKKLGHKELMIYSPVYKSCPPNIRDNLLNRLFNK
jgi:hypothetical protein